MSGKQYQGTATIRVNGQEYETLEGGYIFSVRF